MTSAAVITLSVSGMSCANCQHHVTEALSGVPGVATADVDLDGGRATVTLADPSVPLDALTAAVYDAGYEASPLEG